MVLFVIDIGSSRDVCGVDDLYLITMSSICHIMRIEFKTRNFLSSFTDATSLRLFPRLA